MSSVKETLSQVESMLMMATGGVGTAFPVVSNLASLRALNKSGGIPQLERKPIDVMVQRQSRKRAREAAQINLHSTHTPLVEAHRPREKRTAEAERLRKTYEAAARKSRVPGSRCN